MTINTFFNNILSQCTCICIPFFFFFSCLVQCWIKSTSLFKCKLLPSLSLWVALVIRPISQIPQCIKYPTMHHFVTESVHFRYKMVHCEIWDWCNMGYGTGALWDYEFGLSLSFLVNTLRPEQYACHLTGDIFMNDNTVFLFHRILSINNKLELVQVVAWHQQCDKSLSPPMMILFFDAI